MNGTQSAGAEEHKLLPAKELLKALAPYRQPKLKRSIFELFITIIPFIGFLGSSVVGFVSQLLAYHGFQCCCRRIPCPFFLNSA